MSAWDQFIEDLRDALNNMHDPDRLRRSALARQLGVADRPDTYTALSRILTDAIRALEPADGEPTNSRAWRIYELLTARYIQGLNGDAVAHQIGVTVRHLRREQHAAIQALGYYLWQRFRLDRDTTRETRPAPPSFVLEEDLTWIRDTAPEHPADLAEALTVALKLVSSLATSRGTRLAKTMPPAVPRLAIHSLALEQILLAMLSAGINCAPSDVLHVEAMPTVWEVEIRVRAEGMLPGRRLAREEEVSLQIASHLAELSGGHVTVAGSEPFNVVAVLPALEQLPVLAIDDNADALQLYQRFAAGTRFRLIGMRDPQEAIGWAEQNKPQVILLDVMMPGLDGWRLLGRLKQHPVIGDIPVIVCTILKQRDLALSLGAADFLPKPVSQSALLEALYRAIERARLECG